VKRFVGFVFVLLGIALLLILGFWQIQRLHWKEDLIARIARYQSEDVDLAPYLHDQTVEFRRGTLKGHWQAADTFRTRNILKDGNFGYWVATPLALTDGTKILVNRGWVQDGQQDKVLAYKLPSGIVTVHGTIRRAGLLDREAQTKQYPGWVLFADRTVPADHAELQPAPVAVELWNHHREYAIFWFVMAGLLAGMGLFSLLRRR
jgi:cytochrome oxidase assembly protein ShyY1